MKERTLDHYQISDQQKFGTLFGGILSLAVIGFVTNYFIICSQDLTEGRMTYTDISSSDLTFNNLTSFGDFNSTMNFVVGTPYTDIDLNDNEYIRIRAYSFNEKF